MFELATFLVERAILTRAQVDEAREAQVVFGGRLGTNLVELGALSLDELGEHLAACTGFTLAPKEWIATPDAAALAAVPLELAARLLVLPLRVVEGALHVAMLDPADARVEGELERAVGRRVRGHLLPELRLRYALERHLGIRRPPRFANVARKLERIRRIAGAAAGGPPEEEQLRSALGITPLRSGEELIDETSFAALHETFDGVRDRAQAAASGEDELVLDDLAPDAAPAGPPPGPDPEPADGTTPERPAPAAGPPPRPSPGAAELEADLALARDGDAAARAGLALARHYARYAALFVVHRGMVMGLAADGDGPPRDIGGVLVPTDVESVLARAATAAEVFRGSPPVHGVDARVLRALRRGAAREIAVLPVSVRGRVVNVLYADDCDRPLARTTVAALGAAADCLSAAYERLILERKRGS